jgi:hypothetical protein
LVAVMQAWLALTVLMLATPTAAADQGAALEEVGHDDLGARGLNAGLALADHCAYVGSRGQGPIAIEDVSDPAHPRSAGSLPGRPLTTAREVRALPARKLLVVLNYALGRGGVNRLDLYRWSDDCTHLAPSGTYDFGGRPPHEMFLWQATGGDRTLLFTTMFSGGAGDLQVIDATDPAAPRLAGTWSSPVGLLHSISLSSDGRRAFLSMWTGGLLVADASQFTSGQPNPQLSVLTPIASRLQAPAGGNVHSAVPIPGKDLVLITDERGLVSGAPSLSYSPDCPYGPARLVDVSDPAQPRALSTLSAPENDPATCRSSQSGNYSSHNPTLIDDLALVTWYSSGLQVFDVSNPGQPQRLAEFRAQGSEPGQRDAQLGVTATMTWSYPIVRNGLVYVADVNQGLYVLRYRGPHQDALGQVAFAEGNSNLLALLPPPTPTPTAAPATTLPRGVGGVPRAAGGGGTLVVYIIAGLLVLTVIGAISYIWLRRRQAVLP